MNQETLNGEAGGGLGAAPCSANPCGPETDTIRAAYDRADAALRQVGKLLRTTHAGEYLWSADHKTAISGLRVVVQKLRQDVPYYNDSPNADAHASATKEPIA